MKKIIALFIVSILSLVVTLSYNTFTMSSTQVSVTPVKAVSVNEDAVERFSQCIQIPSISNRDLSLVDTAAFLRVHDFLSKSYPLCDSVMHRTLVGDYSLIYTWKGSDASLKPIMCLAHTDVVPIADPKSWGKDPFSGAVADGFIWGRGTLDVKVGVIGLMEAAELLIAAGFTPKRTIIFGFGHDEEVGGKGARAIVQYLEKQNITLEWLLDEGMFITKGIAPGLSMPLASVGIAEKGYLSVALSAKSIGGHSSMPPKQSAIGELSAAMVALEKNRLPQEIGPTIEYMFRSTGPESDFPYNMIFANLWLFKPILAGQLANSRTTNALTRTTTAPTILNAGVQDNVLAAEANGTINFRILPNQNQETVLTHIKNTIQNDNISVKALPGYSPPVPPSDINGIGYKAVEKTIRQIFPSTIVAPALVIATTDSRYYTAVCKNIYRFLPFELTASDIERIHGVDERISIEGYKKAVQFYHQLLINAQE